tara:strand:- start:1053 stop:1610 length:558 start_codon:yes stop_codon:yes gene_type:complete
MVKMLRRESPRTKEPSRVFGDLKGIKLADLTNDEYNSLIENTFLEPDNVEFLSDLASVIRFQEKPKGLQLTKAVQSGAVDSSSNVTLLEIPAGKTYDIQTITAISTTGTSAINYAINGFSFDVGTDYLIKVVDYTTGLAGVVIDFSTQGDWLISGNSDSSTYLVASRRSGTGSVSAHNVFYREVN